MARGGKRDGAGRKSGWLHPETTVIRVPKVFASQLIEIAQKLDNGEYLDSVSESEKVLDNLVAKSLLQLVSDWKEKASSASAKNSRWIKARQILAEMQSILAGEKAGLETVSESMKVSDQLNIPVNESVTKSIGSMEPSLSPLSGKDLSKRFGLGRTAVWDAKKRCAGNTKEFLAWSKERDPSGVGWNYNEQSKKYCPNL